MTREGRTSAPGFHPGLFTTGQRSSIIPAGVNTYEDNSLRSISSEQNISFSVYPEDLAQGRNTLVVGFLSGGDLQAPVNIFGRTIGSEQFQYLTIILPNDQGIFIWDVPEMYYTVSDFQVKTT